MSLTTRSAAWAPPPSTLLSSLSLSPQPTSPSSCTAISPVPLLIVSVLCLLLTASGALASWQVFRDDVEAPARKLVAIISVGCSAFFLLAILLPMIASLMIPPCFG